MALNSMDLIEFNGSANSSVIKKSLLTRVDCTVSAEISDIHSVLYCTVHTDIFMYGIQYVLYVSPAPMTDSLLGKGS
jgi:hypothetical protein